ncbi:MAG: zinc-ribbon domain-containing protein, partial [Bacilli bacterium]|nr:zinc-ribbon domain-containing protein [Bacilli bacterium]
MYLKDNRELMKEYNYKKNDYLDLNKLTLGSKKNINWICEKGHEWKANICDRYRGNGCPYCSNKKVLKGYNDLETLNPKLAKEWNYEKNKDLLPNEVLVGSNMKVWWKCEKGHEWEAQIYSRNSGHKCPYCMNQKVLKGYNDFGTFYPSLLKEWDYDKNNKYTPYSISKASNMKVWWKCKKGHEWECSVYKKINGAKCPYCQGRKLLKGYNDLATMRKDLIKEWSNTNKKQPSEYYYKSPVVVEWVCEKGHHYKTAIRSRTALNVGCPYCTNQKVLKG